MNLETMVESILNFLHQNGLALNRWGLAYLLLIIPGMLSFSFKLSIEGDLFRNSLRAVAQLLFMALLLIPVFNSSAEVHLMLLLAMIFMGSYIAYERGKDTPHSFTTALFSIFLGTVVVMGAALATGVLTVAPNILIPIGSMVVGNASRTMALFFSRAESDFSQHQLMTEALMVDGLDFHQAMEIPMRLTLKTSLIPMIDSLRTLGIVHIPGAMAGMMAAGASPLEAAGYQIFIFFSIIASASISTIIATRRTYVSLFNRAYPHLER